MAQILVTGATNGIGRVAALALAEQGHHIGVHGRSEGKAEEVREAIVSAGGTAEVFLADLSSLAQVRALADDVLARWEHIDVLLNNAGLINTARILTTDGNELTWAVNHLAPFLLTLRLKDRILACDGRVVNVASDAHFGATVAFDDLDAERSFAGWKRYQSSKLMNVLFTRELARREPKLMTVSLHPGFVASGFGMNTGWMKWVMRLTRMVQLSETDGAKTSVWCCTTAGLESGSYYAKSALKTPSKAALTQADGERLWAESEARVAEFVG